MTRSSLIVLKEETVALHILTVTVCNRDSQFNLFLVPKADQPRIVSSRHRRSRLR